MSDLELAKANLEGHSICLCANGEVITDDGRGISPMMRFIAEGRMLKGFSAADLIVGKAAAMLFVKAGIAAVYGKTVSRSGLDFLTEHGIPCEYGVLTERIINREGTDICPMEKVTADIDDPDEAYEALGKRLSEMQKR